jgi:hypothetical protein
MYRHCSGLVSSIASAENARSMSTWRHKRAVSDASKAEINSGEV